MKHAINIQSMKRRNRKLILNLIRQENVSRAEIATRLRLTKAAVSALVDELTEDNIVYSVSAEYSGMGRPSLWLRINADACYCVGIDITRRNISVGLINAVGEILFEYVLPVGEVEETLRRACDTVQGEIDRLGIDRSRILGVGLTTPGPLNKHEQVILQPTNFPGWHNVKVGEILTSLTGWRVWMDNIANAWALGETYFGVARGLQNFFALSVDSGVGSGVILDGKIFDGMNEIGHTSIDYRGPICECGNCGCLELYARLPAFLEGIGYRTWSDLVKQNDLPQIKRMASYLSTAIVNAANFSKLEMVVLVSEIAQAPHPLIEMIQEQVARRRPNAPVLPIRATEIHSSMQCAATLALDHFFQ